MECYTGPYKWYAADKGGVLADDMGLGKTLQTIAFLAAVLKSPAAIEHAGGPPSPALIVCPTSVLTNWERELNQWGRAGQTLGVSVVWRILNPRLLSQKASCDADSQYLAGPTVGRAPGGRRVQGGVRARRRQERGVEARGAQGRRPPGGGDRVLVHCSPRHPPSTTKSIGARRVIARIVRCARRVIHHI